VCLCNWRPDTLPTGRAWNPTSPINTSLAVKSKNINSSRSRPASPRRPWLTTADYAAVDVGRRRHPPTQPHFPSGLTIIFCNSRRGPHQAAHVHGRMGRIWPRHRVARSFPNWAVHSAHQVSPPYLRKKCIIKIGTAHPEGRMVQAIEQSRISGA